MNMHVKPAVGDDCDLIRLCRKTVEALKADLAACIEADDTQEVFDREKPAYPGFANDMVQAARGLCVGKMSSVELRRILKYVPPLWKASIREHMNAVRSWERQTAELHKSTGVRAADARRKRALNRTNDLMQRVAATPATTLLGIAWKALVAEQWFEAGYGYHDEGEDLIGAILGEVRLLGTGGNNQGKTRVLRSGYRVVEREACEMADAA